MVCWVRLSLKGWLWRVWDESESSESWACLLKRREKHRKAEYYKKKWTLWSKIQAQAHVIFRVLWTAEVANWTCEEHLKSLCEIYIWNSYLYKYEFQIWISYIFHIISLHGKIWTQQIDLAPNVWLHSSIGRASHRYRGSHGFEFRWSLDTFRLLPSNCLNWKIYCHDHSSLLINYV